MSKYKPLEKKRMVYVITGNKRISYGYRTLYTKDASGKVYIRYKNKYYRAYREIPNTYTAIVLRWYNARVLFSDWSPRVRENCFYY